MKQFTQTQIAQILDNLTGRLADYIEECEKLPSKYECDQCGRNAKENFACNCERPQVEEYQACPVCGEWIEIRESVWAHCFSTHIVYIGKSELLLDNKRVQRAFVDFLEELLNKAKSYRPVIRTLGTVMIDIMCEQYEDEEELEKATAFINQRI